MHGYSVYNIDNYYLNWTTFCAFSQGGILPSHGEMKTFFSKQQSLAKVKQPNSLSLCVYYDPYVTNVQCYYVLSSPWLREQFGLGSVAQDIKQLT